MNDHLSSRIRRIITGTANTLVSKIEGLAPLMVLEQAIDEVDHAVAEVKSELGRVTAQKHQVTKAMVRLNESHAKLMEQVAEANKAGRDDLIEAAVSRQIDIEDQLPVLQDQLVELNGQEQGLNSAIVGMLAKRNEMEDQLFDYRKAQEMMAQPMDASSPGGVNRMTGKMEQAEAAFDRMMQKASGLKQSIRRSSSDESAKLVELDNLNRKARVLERMKALKNSE
jgi:phage shock protein A